MKVAACAKSDAPRAQIMNRDLGGRSADCRSVLPTKEKPLTKTAMNSNIKGSPPKDSTSARSQGLVAGLSRQAGLGILRQPAVKKIEDGSTAHSKFLPRIAALLGLDIAELDEGLARITTSADRAPRLLGGIDFPVHASTRAARANSSSMPTRSNIWRGRRRSRPYAAPTGSTSLAARWNRNSARATLRW